MQAWEEHMTELLALSLKERDQEQISSLSDQDQECVRSCVCSHSEFDVLSLSSSLQNTNKDTANSITYDSVDAFVDACAFTLRTLMCLRGMKASDLCKKTGIHKATLSRYFQGKTTIPLFAAYLICRALDYDLMKVVAFSLAVMDVSAQPINPHLS